jgi:hypothetical protein
MKTYTVKTYNPETADLLASLRAHGFTIRGGNNGECYVDAPEKFASESAFLEELLACDEANLYVTRKATRESTKEAGKIVYCRYSLLLVLGNEPGVLVADWGIPRDEEDAKELDAAVSECSDRWEGKEQPMEEKTY